MILVTKPFLPPLEEYTAYLEKIWKNVWLTNDGPLALEFENQLKTYLNTQHLSFVTNGTKALQIAIRTLGLQGEIITTPFTHIATAASIVWQGCVPVMVDICPVTWTIDADKIEAAITDKTSAILAVHIFGVPCEIEKIEAIAKRHHLRVIYDAAHAFGVRYQGRSLLTYGDISACSFHATKLFHTVEGGALITADPALMDQIQLMRSFGQASPLSIDALGINGKNSEVHAAMGLCCFKYLPEILSKRASLYSRYLDNLSNTSLHFQKIPAQTEYNYAYFPVIFKTETEVLSAIQRLNEEKIFPRRYFHPSLSQVAYLGKHHAPISEDISRRILCLPLYHDLSPTEVDRICMNINHSLCAST